MTHILRMALGCLLYWCVAGAMPARLWIEAGSPFWWAVPHFGYYAYHPHDLPWWKTPNVRAKPTAEGGSA